VIGHTKLFMTFFLKEIMIEFTEEEKSFLVKQLQLDLTWNRCMAKDYKNPFTQRVEIITSLLSKLGEHPFKTKLEENSKF
jgi:hypothetical protein